jgi:galactonate dehydratase
MKITEVSSHPLQVGDRNQLLVKVTTDSGLYGWGESGLATRERAVAGVVEHFARFLVGRNPMAIGALWQEMYRGQYMEGGRVITAAISAIDIALHDIKGKALGVPVYELLGGRQRNRVPTFASVRAETTAELIAQARTVAAAGWRCVRLLPFTAASDRRGSFEPWAVLAEVANALVEIRAALGPAVAIGIDWHHRLSPAEAVAFCHRLPAGVLDWLEEPIRDETPEAYEALRRLTPIPFALGEEFASKWQFRPYIERSILQYARIDICNVGGFTEAMKVAGWCEAHYIDLMPHNPLGPVCTAATLHLAAAVPNFAWLECRETPSEPDYGRLVSPAFIGKPVLEGACYPVPEGPGLGIDIDEARLPAAGAFRYFETPRLWRADGSLTNW